MVWVRTLVNLKLTLFLLTISCGLNVKRQGNPNFVPFEWGANWRGLRDYLRQIVGALRDFVLGKKKKCSITLLQEGNHRLGELLCLISFGL